MFLGCRVPCPPETRCQSQQQELDVGVVSKVPVKNARKRES